MIVQAVQQEKLREVKITRREVEQFFEAIRDSLPEMPRETKLRHILLEIRPGEAARERAIATMRELQDKIRQGESFEDVAARYSEDEGTAPNGGLLGMIERGTLFPEFEEVAFQMEDGAISDIVETPIGLHLIKLEEKRGEKVRVRHILLRLGATTDDETFVSNRLNEIRDRILNEEVTFEEMAKEHTADESTRDRGGDLGWLPLEEVTVPEFTAAANALQPGEISKPFKTEFGYHIIFLEDRRESRKMSLDTDWERIQYQALNAKHQKVLQEWVEELKKNIYIEIKEAT